MNDSYEFEKICKNAIIKYYEENSEITDNKHLTIKDVYVVWMCKTLQNSKALLSTTNFDGMYFECTIMVIKKNYILMLIKSGKILELKKKILIVRCNKWN